MPSFPRKNQQVLRTLSSIMTNSLNTQFQQQQKNIQYRVSFATTSTSNTSIFQWNLQDKIPQLCDISGLQLNSCSTGISPLLDFYLIDPKLIFLFVKKNKPDINFAPQENICLDSVVQCHSLTPADNSHPHSSLLTPPMVGLGRGSGE